MKRMIVMLLVLALTAPAAGLAGGLSGLGSGGLSGLKAQEERKDHGVLPDPADILDAAGSVLKRDYMFSADYICTAYTYPIPENVGGFVAAYTDMARKNGFTPHETVAEGYTGWLYHGGDGSYALLFPEFDGMMLLLVENGMLFGEPVRTDLYISFSRNGHPIELKWAANEAGCTEVLRSSGSSTSFEIGCFFERAPIGYLTLAFPNSAQAGDVFRASKENSINGLSFYTDEDGVLVYHDTADNAFRSDSDHLTVSIVSMEELENGTVIEGTFEASLMQGGLTYTDGSFRVLCRD